MHTQDTQSRTNERKNNKTSEKRKKIESIISITTSNFAYVKRKHLCILLCLLEYTACCAFILLHCWVTHKWGKKTARKNQLRYIFHCKNHWYSSESQRYICFFSFVQYISISCFSHLTFSAIFFCFVASRIFIFPISLSFPLINFSFVRCYGRAS